MKPNIKKLLILNAPYLLFVYLFDKVGQAVRLSPGADLSGKLLSIGSGFSAAFSNALPSFAPMDLLIGIVGAVVIRLAVYVKGKNAKKYRKGMEYGSARWGNAEDIKPYIDPMFENNVLLTQRGRGKYGSGYPLPMLATNVFIPYALLRSYARFCQTSAKEKRCNPQKKITTLSKPYSILTDTSYLPSVSTSAISFAVALTIRMPVSLIPSRSASSCRRCVFFSGGVSKRNWSTDIL